MLIFSNFRLFHNEFFTLATLNGHSKIEPNATDYIYAQVNVALLHPLLCIL